MRKRNQSGFTLIETIAAIVLLTLSVPPMLWALRQAHDQRVGPIQASQARWLAAEKLETIIADRHSATRGYDYIIAANYPFESSVNGFEGFARTVAINETGPDLITAGTGYKKVTVTVSWTDVTGAARTLSVSTVVTDYPAS